MGSRRILLVLAHPDDESFICGGTLAKYAAEGVQITLVCATKGEMGRRVGIPPSVTRETMYKVRERELEEACKALGITDLRYMGLIDKMVEFADEKYMIDQIAEVMRELKPDVVLTFHERYGGHPDHCAIGKFCTAAYKLVNKLPHISGKQSSLYFISIGERLKLNPEKFGYKPDQITEIDISGYLNQKLQAFRAHRSQSEIERWVWTPDQQAVQKFIKREYFMQADGLAGHKKNDLFSN